MATEGSQIALIDDDVTWMRMVALIWEVPA